MFCNRVRVLMQHETHQIFWLFAQTDECIRGMCLCGRMHVWNPKTRLCVKGHDTKASARTLENAKGLARMMQPARAKRAGLGTEAEPLDGSVMLHEQETS